MKILFCSHVTLSRELGAPRVVLELADALRPLGWECEVVGPQDLPAAPGLAYARALREYLHRRAGEFDVVDYDYQYLPFPRREFAAGTLLVARSVLLIHYLRTVFPPEVNFFHQRVKSWLTRGRVRGQRRYAGYIADAQTTTEQADAVNVANDDDRRTLLAAGIAPEKIAVVPYGLNAAEFAALAPLNTGAAALPPRVCFLGTFDARKGGADLPKICARIARRVPGCRFRLVGTAGLHRTREAVLSFFPRGLRAAVEVVPQFGRADLPGLLEGCTAGVFPSYYEGFGFGVLEMLAAGIPVVAYRCPGPPAMLGEEFLVPRGDHVAMADRVAALLEDESARRRAAGWARDRAGTFPWEAAARQTDEDYRRRCREHRAAGPG